MKKTKAKAKGKGKGKGGGKKVATNESRDSGKGGGGGGNEKDGEEGKKDGEENECREREKEKGTECPEKDKGEDERAGKKQQSSQDPESMPAVGEMEIDPSPSSEIESLVVPSSTIEAPTSAVETPTSIATTIAKSSKSGTPISPSTSVNSIPLFGLPVASSGFNLSALGGPATSPAIYAAPLEEDDPFLLAEAPASPTVDHPSSPVPQPPSSLPLFNPPPSSLPPSSTSDRSPPAKRQRRDANPMDETPCSANAAPHASQSNPKIPLHKQMRKVPSRQPKKVNPEMLKEFFKKGGSKTHK